MKDSQCPHCHSNTVYTRCRGLSFGNQGVFYVHVSSKFATRATCGYYETYIEDRARLEVVAKDWKKVG